MQQRIEANPDDADAKAYFEKKKNKQLVDEQYHQTVQEYPERYDEARFSYLILAIFAFLNFLFILDLSIFGFGSIEFSVWGVF